MKRAIPMNGRRGLQLPAATMTATMAVTMLAIVSAVRASETCDTRIALDNPERFPFNTITTLRYDADFDGDLSATGSGALVSPYMVLTAGHCVYMRSESHYIWADIHIQPAAHLDGSGDIVRGPQGGRRH